MYHSCLGLDHGADRVGNTASTVDTVISRHIGVDSIVNFNFDSRTIPRVVDSDLTAVADYWSHWHFSLFSEEQIERAEQCGQSVPFTESKMRWQLQHRCLTQGPCDTASARIRSIASSSLIGILPTGGCSHFCAWCPFARRSRCSPLDPPRFLARFRRPSAIAGPSST